MPSAPPLYLPDFMTGILAALAQKNVTGLSMRRGRLDDAFAKLTQELLQDSRDRVDLRFRIRLHPIHGDSSALQQALYEAAQRDLISLDNPEFQKIRLKISASNASAYLQQLPGGPDFYLQLADRLLGFYKSQRDEPLVSKP